MNEIEVFPENDVVMLLVDTEKRTLEKAHMAESVKHVYEQGGLKISKVIDLRSKVDTSTFLVYLVAGGQIRWKEMFIGPNDSPLRNRIS